MVLAKELIDKLKKIEDFDITYESSDQVFNGRSKWVW